MGMTLPGRVRMQSLYMAPLPTGGPHQEQEVASLLRPLALRSKCQKVLATLPVQCLPLSHPWETRQEGLKEDS